MPSERSERVLTSLFLALRSKARGKEPEQLEPLAARAASCAGFPPAEAAQPAQQKPVMIQEAPPVVKKANHRHPPQSKVWAQGNE